METNEVMVQMENLPLSVIQSIPDLTPDVIVWSTVKEGIDLPLQALRSCYRIDEVTEEDVFLAMCVPNFQNSGSRDWEYVPDQKAILTKNKLLAACLKNRGREISTREYKVGLVYSEVIEELEKRSEKTLKDVLEILKGEVRFHFESCTLNDGIEAATNSIQSGSVEVGNGFLSCKNFRIALELVKITGRTPILVTLQR
jgi:hypothetical protein